MKGESCLLRPVSKPSYVEVGNGCRMPIESRLVLSTSASREPVGSRHGDAVPLSVRDDLTEKKILVPAGKNMLDHPSEQLSAFAGRVSVLMYTFSQMEDVVVVRIDVIAAQVSVLDSNAIHLGADHWSLDLRPVGRGERNFGNWNHLTSQVLYFGRLIPLLLQDSFCPVPSLRELMVKDGALAGLLVFQIMGLGLCHDVSACFPKCMMNLPGTRSASRLPNAGGSATEPHATVCGEESTASSC
jgi:hypothetical protein